MPHKNASALYESEKLSYCILENCTVGTGAHWPLRETDGYRRTWNRRDKARQGKAADPAAVQIGTL